MNEVLFVKVSRVFNIIFLFLFLKNVRFYFLDYSYIKIYLFYIYYIM